MTTYNNRETETALISGYFREPKGSWVSLMDEARNDNLVSATLSPSEVAYLIKEMAPHSQHGLMIVPDLINPRTGKNKIITPVDLSDEGLASLLNFSGDVLQEAFNDRVVAEADFGFSYNTEDSPKTKEDLQAGRIRRKLASVSEHLHLHISCYTAEDLGQTISGEDLKRHSNYRAAFRDPLLRTSHEIINSLVVNPIQQKPGGDFDRLFLLAPDQTRLTFEFKQGLDGFSDPGLARILKDIHIQSLMAYQKIVSCFCQTDPDKGEFLESAGGRYRLLPQEERIKRIGQFIGSNSYLSDYSKDILLRLARRMKNEDSVIEEGLTLAQEKKVIELSEAEKRELTIDTVSTLWAFKGLAYTMVCSSYGGKAWFLGIDPRFFSAPGPPPSSRAHPKMFWRTGEVFPSYMLQEAERFEQELTARLIERDSSYTAGPAKSHLFFEEAVADPVAV